jgi:NodT family efflux transporter outer membrane factor (OMF) lipoprotein
MSARRIRLGVLAAAALLASCKVGPNYMKPSAPVPAAYKEVKGWKIATPQAPAANQPWWALYTDAALDKLEKKIDISNQNLKLAEAQYVEAQTLVAQAEAQLYPTVTANGSAQRGGNFARQMVPTTTTASPVPITTSIVAPTGNQISLTGVADWEPDIWGKIRRTIEGESAAAQASAADLAAARLSAQTTLATDYFELRATDEQKRLLDAAVIAYRESLRITQNQFQVGNAALSAVISAKTQLEQTQAQAINTGIARAQFEHAIAVLVGEAPGDFAIPAVSPMPSRVPVTPPGLPSVLLERNPTVAAAERQMQQANAQIGIAIAAYYPDITLSGTLGLASTGFGNLFSASSALWAIGGQLSETVFDAGLRQAEVEQARAGYEAAIATYRQTVLSSFQQVEDQLASLRVLADQAVVEDQAVVDAREAERLTLNQYLAGTVAYTSVIVAQTTALSNEESALAILEQRFIASVALVAALGGGWNQAELPKEPEIPGVGHAEPPPEAKTWFQQLIDQVGP